MPGPNRIITLASIPGVALCAKNKTAALALEALFEALAAEELTALHSTVDRDDVCHILVSHALECCIMFTLSSEA